MDHLSLPSIISTAKVYTLTRIRPPRCHRQRGATSQPLPSWPQPSTYALTRNRHRHAPKHGQPLAPLRLNRSQSVQTQRNRSPHRRQQRRTTSRSPPSWRRPSAYKLPRKRSPQRRQQRRNASRSPPSWPQPSTNLLKKALSTVPSTTPAPFP